MDFHLSASSMSAPALSAIICFLIFKGSTCSLAKRHLLDVCTLIHRGGSLPVLALSHVSGSIFRLSRKPSLLPTSFSRCSVSVPCGLPAWICTRRRTGLPRSTQLIQWPAAVKGQLQEHLKDVKQLQEKDLSLGHGDVHLPDALSRKYPNAGKEWAWQYA